MIELIKDIQQSIEAKAYLSALALALTLPDICSKVAEPDKNKIGERYADWYDEHVIKRLDESPIPWPFFDGEKCWKLRCAFFHEGRVQNINGLDKEICKFELGITEPGSQGISISNSVVNYNNTNAENTKYYYRVHVDVFNLCNDLCIAAENFYRESKDKSKFANPNIVVKRL